jgi:dihydroxyacetone kinase-like protein
LNDKTMVDALTPAVEALEAGGDDVAAAVDAAAEAAETGRDATVPLVARKGRASYLGERSAGHMDPGAASTALLLRTLAQVLAA